MKKKLIVLLGAVLLGVFLIGCGKEKLSEEVKHITWEPIDNQVDATKVTDSEAVTTDELTDEKQTSEDATDVSLEETTQTEQPKVDDLTLEPLYKAFLNNEISVSNPYNEGMELTVMDDEGYETEFEDAQKSYALVDVNLDEKEELIFKISAYPSELMYILGIYNDELICFDVFETHTKNMGFGVYDYGMVWWSQNYDGFEMICYSYSADGKPQEARRFGEGDEADIAAHEGGEPEWFMLNVQENSKLDEFISGKINADGNGLYGNDSFNISELPMNEEEWDSYSIGDRIDLDNDGNDELILNGPYGGMYMDASDNGVKVFAKGDGTASNLSYTYCGNEIWIVHSDTMHSGRKYYKLQKYSGADNVVESVTLEMHYSEDETTKSYYCNDGEISESEYNDLYQKYLSNQ